MQFTLTSKCIAGPTFIHISFQIKVIDPSSCTCTTLAGTGIPGLKDGPCKVAQFNEPGGLNVCKDGKALVVADTNNNAIRVINLETKFVEKVTCFLKTFSNNC